MLAFAIVLFSLQQPTAAPLPPLPPQVGDTSPFRSVSAGSEANPTLRTPPHARVRHRPVLSATADCGPTPPAPPSGGRHVAVPTAPATDARRAARGLGRPWTALLAATRRLHYSGVAGH